METHKSSEFRLAGIPDFVQDNQSRSTKGTLRGLHFQTGEHAQGKLVRVLSGEIFDVAVDLREGSPCLGTAHTIRLSATTPMLYIPPWCAHGFCVLSDVADVAYKTTVEYAQAFEAGIAWDDPDLGVEWPISEPALSRRDREWPRLRDAKTGFHYDAASVRSE